MYTYIYIYINKYIRYRSSSVGDHPAIQSTVIDLRFPDMNVDRACDDGNR
jgi:hypothetical protein